MLLNSVSLAFNFELSNQKKERTTALSFLINVFKD